MSQPPEGGYPRGFGPHGQSYGPPGQPPPGPPPGPGPEGQGAYGRQQWQSPQDAYAPYLRGRPDDYPPPAADLPLAPILRRARARLIDFFLVAVFGFGLIFPIMVGAFGLDTPGTDAGEEGGGWTAATIFALFFVAAVLPFLYEVIQLTISGQTIGKRILGLRVVRTDPAGDPIDVMTATWRAAINNIGYQIPIFFFLLLAVKVFTGALLLMFAALVTLLIAYLRAAWDQPLHQAVHDRYAATVVVDDTVEWEEEE
jgi:uncharacterized RDD family membrane protein YckC